MNTIIRNNVKISGRGKKAIIFSHGYGCSQNMWRLVAPAFEETHQVILFDLVGAGDSEVAAYDRIKYGTLHGYADDLLEIVSELELTEVVLVGHSVSAMIGILAAIKNPKVFDKLVLIGPSPCYVNDGNYVGGFSHEALHGLVQQLESNFESWAHALAPVIIGKLNRPELGVELTQSFCKAEPEIAKHFARVVFLTDMRRDLPKLQVPSLILQCSEDAVAPEAVGVYLNRKLKGSTLIKLKATGHCPHVSSPEEVIEVIQGYLRQASPKKAAA